MIINKMYMHHRSMQHIHSPANGRKRSVLVKAERKSLDDIVGNVYKAQQIFSKYSQSQVDKIFKEAALAANAARIPLAKLAYEETQMGLLEDKVIKNHFASEYIYNKYKDLQTCGIIENHFDSGMCKIAEPVGLVAAITPVTNSTSTTIFKTLISLKTRNGIIVSPHPKAKHATVQAAKIVLDAAVNAGAPENIIGWLEDPTIDLTQALMKHPQINLILSTGGPSLVKASYSSGNPAIGVGAGNTPVIIDDSADIKMAVSSIILSKTFDNGLICASEQSVIVSEKIYEEVKREFLYRGAYFLNKQEKQKVSDILFSGGRLNAEAVGKSAMDLAQMFDLENIPPFIKLYIAELEDVGKTEPLSGEKLSLVLGLYKVKDYRDALNTAYSLIQHGGKGHTSVLYTNPQNQRHIEHFQNIMNTARILINTPASQGAIGDIFNFNLNPSLSLGGGSWASTSVSTNVTPSHLLNIKTVTQRRENMLWMRLPPKIYFKGGCLEVALRELSGKKRAFIVTDKPLYDMNFTDTVTNILDEIGVHHKIFADVKPDPDIECIRHGLKELESFKPDIIIALGGGSPMDAAKIMWLLYEDPTVTFEGMSLRFMDIRKRVYKFPELGNKAIMIAIPTTSGTGSDVTPFSVITDEISGQKYPFADYSLTPSVAIIDPQLVMTMPKSLVAYGGIDALTHALESYVSICATDYTRGLSKEAIKSIFKYLSRSYHLGDYESREAIHNAATISGMAFANAFLGICHSMAHKLGAKYHIPHGLANAAMIGHVIKYNARDIPFKQATFPQYTYPRAKQDYAELAKMLDCKGMNDDELVENLVRKIEYLKKNLGIPLTLKEIIGKDKEEDYMKNVDELALNAFDDQCTGTNPVYPLISHLKDILIYAWDNPVLSDV